MGQRGFHGASVEVDPDSLVTPWLVALWLAVVLRELRRAHARLRRWYDLIRVRTPKRHGGIHRQDVYAPGACGCTAGRNIEHVLLPIRSGRPVACAFSAICAEVEIEPQNYAGFSRG
jgi:hypothetical protein